MYCAVNINVVPVVWIEKIPLRSGVRFSHLCVNVVAAKTEDYKRNKFSHNGVFLRLICSI